MRATPIFITCVFMVGCATAPVVEEQIVIEEPVAAFTPELNIVSATQDGVITKLRGTAYINDEGVEGFFPLKEGATIPLNRIFYLSPRTTMKIEQESGEEIFLYSKEHRTYYRLEPDTP